MSWVHVTLDDLHAYLPADVAKEAREAALDAVQTDPWDIIMPDVVAELRAAVLGCARNEVDIDPLKVPPSLKGIAATLIGVRLLNRIDGARVGEAFAKQVEKAEETLKLVASCERTVEAPATAATANPNQQAGGVEIAGQRDREATRAKLDGL